MRVCHLLLLTLVSSALVSCGGGSRPFGGAPGIQAITVNELPTPTPVDFKAADRPYRIGPFDRLVVNVFRVPDLSDLQIQVDASGRISFPLIGTLEVAGLTPAEMEESLETRLRGRYINDPQVTVNLQEVGSQMVTVGGEVGKPGLYPVLGRMTLMRAVATAAGPTEFARRDDVIIFRTVNNTEYAALYNLKAIERGNYPDPEVFANDVVMVGQNETKRFFRDYVSPFVAPVILATQRITNP
jgi:polysaccharide biosynthesis/export protein